MIRSFGDRATETACGWVGYVRQFGGIENHARRKLDMLHQARDLSDLRLRRQTGWKRFPVIAEASTRIRINDQWRVCFIWTKEGPENVEIVDYH